MTPLFDDYFRKICRVVDALTDERRKPVSGGADVQANAGGDMQPEWMEETTLHPLAVVVLVIMAAAVIGGKRWAAVLAMLLFVSCISGAQNVNLFGTSWYLLRILILCGGLRCILRGEWRTVRWNAVDAFVLAWSISATVIYLIQRGEFSAFIYKAGMTIDSMGAYFVFRGLLKDKPTIENALRSLAFIAIPVSLFFVLESMTRYNMFSMFGGVPEITVAREGRLRCQGPFSHPILAGVFWASTFPISLALILSGRGPILGLASCCACCVIILACSSSTPIIGIAVGCFGIGMFLIRRQIRLVFYGVVATLCGLHLVMKAPVWHLLARTDVIGGSTGHYRFMLVDASIRFFHEWYLAGLASNEHWGRSYGHYLTDITNQYVLEGLRGGILTLMLFVAVIAHAFCGIGRVIRSNPPLSDQWLAWSPGAALFVHCVCFLAVSYFGQIVMLYYFHLAMVASLPGVIPGLAANRALKLAPVAMSSRAVIHLA
jgi:hypothetical protein